jgi:putative ABC transport system permease protein
MSPLFADVRFALRGMLKRPALSLLMIATLAVGLAANAAIFSQLDALLRRGLDFPDGPRLLRLHETAPGQAEYDKENVAPANLLDWREQSAGVFESMVGLAWWDANVRGRELPERVQGFRVSPAFFETMGIVPPAGRGFLAEEGTGGRERVIVLGHDLWQRSFGGDASVLGAAVTVDGEPHVVVGIAPAGFRFPFGTEVWAPLVSPAPGQASRDRHYLSVIARLAPGRSIDDARAAMEVVARRLEADHPKTNAARGVAVQTLRRGYEDVGLRPILALWQAAAVFVLLIASVNVANLVMARGAERQRELAVRMALGAARARIVRQLVTEGLVIALLAVGLALPLAGLAVREMRLYMPAEIQRFVPGWERMSVDAATMAFTAGLGVLTVLLFATLPALRVSRPDLTESLKDGGRAATAGASRQRGRNALVVAQVAAALTLVATAGLAVKGARAFLGGPQGFDPDGVLTFQVILPQARYEGAGTRAAFARDLESRLRELPGVTGVTFANVLPASTNNWSTAIRLEGEPPLPPGQEPLEADTRVVAPSHLGTLRIPVVAGRDLLATDTQGTREVAVVSRAFAERHWPGRDPVGQRFRAGGDDSPLIAVVGVSGDVIHNWFARRNHPTFYRPFDQAPSRQIAFAVRTSGDPEALAASARRALAAVDPEQPAFNVRTLHRAISVSTIGLQFVAGVMAVFGALAVLLAVSGVYGVMAYRVSLRTLEIGVRMALGASPADVLRLTLGQAARLTAAGLAIGTGLGFAGSRAIEGALMGAIPFDATAFAAMTALLAAAALLAAYVPARRALAVDPTRALRSE